MHPNKDSWVCYPKAILNISFQARQALGCNEIIIPPEEEQLHTPIPENDFEDDLTDLNLDSPRTPTPPPENLVKPLQKSVTNRSRKKVKDEQEDYNNSPDENNLKPDDEMYETIGSKVGSFRY